MRFVISDPHGEFDLFMKLIKKIGFSKDDELYILGDVIDKGPSPIRLLKYVLETPNIKMIIGNHEYDFLKFYHSEKKYTKGNSAQLLATLQSYFVDGELLDMSMVEELDSLPYYFDFDDFLGVHAGVPVDECGRVMTKDNFEASFLVYDRRFKDPSLVPLTDKCVIFGHTTTDRICGVNKILAYRKRNIDVAKSIRDYAKIHIDTGSWSSGVLGCLEIDTMRVYYVRKR